MGDRIWGIGLGAWGMGASFPFIGGEVDPVLTEVGVQTEASNEMVLQQASVHEVSMVTAGMDVASGSAESSQGAGEQLQGDQDETNSSSEICDDDDTKDLSKTEMTVAVARDPIASSSGTSYNLRRRSDRENEKNATEERVELQSDEDCDDEDDTRDIEKPATATSASSRATHQRSNSNRRNPTGNLSGRQRFECGRCKAILSSARNLNHHMKKVHKEEVRENFSCYVCNKRFLHKSNFSQHLRTHPWKQSYKCKTCNKILNSKKSLKKHMESHNPNRERKFVCPTCSNRFFTSGELKQHMVIHRSEKPFKCPRCPKRFKFPHEVKKHLVTHSEMMPFLCDLCEKRFKRAHELVRHIRIHTGERPYSCQTCQKTFTHASNLSRHMRTHQGEERKSHQCPFCEMKFADKYNCRRHQQTHHKPQFASSAQLDSKVNTETA